MSDLYKVDPEFARASHCDRERYRAMYERSIRDPDGFWAEQAKELITWSKPWDRVSNWSYNAADLHIRWFEGAKLNAAYNCVDRHLAKRGEQVAILWEGDDPVGIVGLLVEMHLQTEWQLGYITDLRVYPRFRGKGYGSKLMDFVAEEAKRQNCYCVHVDTYAGSAYNMVFYTRNGYAPVGVIADMNGPGDEGQVWLRKVLGQGKSNGHKIGSRSATGDSP